MDTKIDSTLTVYVDKLPRKLDFMRSSCLCTSTILHNISDRLVELSSGVVPANGPSTSGSALGGLVQSFSVSSDGLTYRFQLAEGFRFSSGEEVTSEDVLVSLQRTLTEPGQSGILKSLILTKHITRTGLFEGLRRISRFRFEIVLQRPVEDFLDCLAMDETPILSAAHLSRGKLVFSGPYSVETVGEGAIVLTANRRHPRFLNGRAKMFARVVLRPLPQSVGNAGAEGLSALLRQHSTLVLSTAAALVADPDFALAPQYHFSSPCGQSLGLRVWGPWEATNFCRSVLLDVVASRFVREGFPFLESTHSFFSRRHPLFAPAELAGSGGRGQFEEFQGISLPTLLSPEQVPMRLVTQLAAKAEVLGLCLDVKMHAGASPAAALPSQCGSDFSAEFVTYPIADADIVRSLEIQFGKSLRHIDTPASELAACAKGVRSKISDRGARNQGLRQFFRTLASRSRIIPMFFVPNLAFLSEDLRQADYEEAGHRLRFWLVEKESPKLTEEGLRRTKLEAITATTQMFAHDVRKPFSLLRMVMESLRAATSLDDIHLLCGKMLPEVDKAMRSVNGMIQDIMEIGTHSLIQREPASPETLIEASLREIFRTPTSSRIKFVYDFEHRHMVDVDVLKILRVFSNILSNAVQAMGETGEICFKTREVKAEGSDAIEFTIRNSRSYIEQEDLPKIFEAFYTRGKRGGTGLGLAIVEKIIGAHGGSIYCRSERPSEGDLENCYVEFVFTLPAATEVENRVVAHLPSQSKELGDHFLGLTKAHPAPHPHNPDQMREIELEREIAAGKESIRVLIVDDEGVYRSWIRKLLESTPELALAVHVKAVESSEEALSIARDFNPQLCLCDIDLGINSIDGFALTRKLRELGIQASIVLHSNRLEGVSPLSVKNAGANGFVPKPLSRLQLLELLCQAQRFRAEGHPVPTLAKAGVARVAIIDDNFVVRHAWKRALKPAQVVEFASPESFLDHLAKARDGEGGYLCIVTDHCFSGTSEMDGISLAKELVGKVTCPVFLSSNFDAESVLGKKGDLGYVHAHLGKHPLSLSSLLGVIRSLEVQNEGKERES